MTLAEAPVSLRAAVRALGGTDAGAWQQTAKLDVEIPHFQSVLGDSVALSDDGRVALLGASDVSVRSLYQGAAYVFARAGGSWRETTRLIAGDGRSGDRLGGSVALSADGNTALIGAAGKELGKRRGRGVAYVFVRSGLEWRQVNELTASNSSAGDVFGSPIALRQGSIMLDSLSSPNIVATRGISLTDGDQLSSRMGLV
jgi:hypothetical protein